MLRARHVTTVAISAVLFGGCDAPPAPAPAATAPAVPAVAVAHAPWTPESAAAAVASLPGYRIETAPHLVLASNLPENKAGAMLREIAAVRASVVRELFATPPQQTVVLFCAATSADYVQLVREVTGAEPTSGAGFYTRRQRAVFLNAQAGALGTGCHELTHALLDEDLGDLELPIWLNEGIASVYEWPELAPDGGYVGSPLHRLAQLRPDGPIPLERLLAADTPAARGDHFGGPDAGRFQATARLLCVFLQQQRRLGALYRDAKAGLVMDPARSHLRSAVESAAGAPLAEVEARFNRWLDRLGPP